MKYYEQLQAAMSPITLAGSTRDEIFGKDTITFEEAKTLLADLVSVIDALNVVLSEIQERNV